VRQRRQEKVSTESSANHLSRRSFLAGAGSLGVALTAGSGLLAACGSGGSSGATPVTWSTWGSPGELQRFQAFTDDFNKHHPKVAAKLVPVPSSGYTSKMLTQLSGGTAPDLFYSSDTNMGQFVQTGALADLSAMLSGPNSESKPSDIFPGLLGVAKSDDGKIYGVNTGCNPVILWYNSGVLSDAGVTELPADAYEAKRWTRDAFQDMVEKVHAKGKSAAVLASSYAMIYSWLTASGGKVYDGGQFVAHEDPKSVETFVWLTNLLRSKVFVYAGSLPGGQGQEAMFMSNNLAFVMGASRFELPTFQQSAGLKYDIVPYPTPDSSLPSVVIDTAYFVMNKKAKHPEAAFTFLTNHVSKAGQTFIQKDSGNQVPTIQGIDHLVTDGNKPPHAKYFIDQREKGYVFPVEEAKTKGLTQEIGIRLDKLFGQGGDPKSALAGIGKIANAAIKAGSVS
jgi:multiple sugar transport system substrate-binding protein